MGHDVGIRLGLRGEAELLASVTVICRGGVGALDAYRVAARVLEGRPAAAAAAIARRVTDGWRLGDAARAAIRRIDPVHAAMLDVTDAAATPEPLARARSHVEARRRVTTHAWTVAVYPACILVLSLLAATILLTVMGPVVAELRASLGVADGHQLFARGRVAVTALSVGTLLVLAAVVPLIVPPGDTMWIDWLRLRIPVAGRMEALVDLLAFTHALGAMHAVGAPSLAGARLGAACARNRVLGQTLSGVADAAAAGAPIGASLRHGVPHLPQVGRWLALVDEGADETEAIRGLATALEAELDAMRERVSSLMEPILVAGAGGVLLLLVVTLIIPLLDLTAGVMP